MKIFGDLHTHSKYSKLNHGKNTIEELVISAKEKGLKQIAITDHGSGHQLFGVKKHLHNKRKQEILELQKKYPDIEILCGLECNLMDRHGKMDLTSAQKSNLDIILMGFHKASTRDFCGFWTFGLPNLIFGKFRVKSNTKAYINCIEKNDIDVITHINQYVRVDCKAVAEVCAKRGTAIEINNRHLCINEKDINDMLQTDVNFVIDSDAHKIADVGEVSNAIAFAEKYNIPKSRILNIEKLWKKQKEK